MNGQPAHPGLILGVAVALLLVALIGGQLLAASTAPAGGIAPTGRILGQTSFAYLGGLRTFAAAVLWNRLEPLWHGYYSTRPVEEVVQFLPTMRLVQILDPQFEQAYYNAAFILARRGFTEEAFTVAREGIKNNPQSGLLLASYAQLLLMQDKKAHLPEMLGLARRGMQGDIRWATPDDKFEGLGIFSVIFELAGDTRTVKAIAVEQARLKSQGAGLGVERDEEPTATGQ